VPAEVQHAPTPKHTRKIMKPGRSRVTADNVHLGAGANAHR
jgi:hypothetical protein